MIVEVVITLVMVTISLKVIWIIYKDIKDPKGYNQKRKKALVYTGVVISCLVIGFLLKTFAREEMSDLFYLLGGHTSIE